MNIGSFLCRMGFHKHDEIGKQFVANSTVYRMVYECTRDNCDHRIYSWPISDGMPSDGDFCFSEVIHKTKVSTDMTIGILETYKQCNLFVNGFKTDYKYVAPGSELNTAIILNGVLLQVAYLKDIKLIMRPVVNITWAELRTVYEMIYGLEWDDTDTKLNNEFIWVLKKFVKKQVDNHTISQDIKDYLISNKIDCGFGDVKNLLGTKLAVTACDTN